MGAAFDPSEVKAFQVKLTGSLGDVLNDGLTLAAQAPDSARHVVQMIRFFCGDGAFARLLRIEIDVPGESTWSITPSGAVDQIDLLRNVPQGQPLQVRLVRGENVDVAALPDLHPVDVRVEIFG